MKIYFPQWQGSGNGTSIAKGAETILNYLKDDSIATVALSPIPSGKQGYSSHHINNYNAITEQLGRFKDLLSEKSPNQIQIIGGDCGLEIVPISYLNKKYSSLGVIWFDAHADINTPIDSPSGNFHGMPLRTLLGEGEIGMESLLYSHIKNDQIHYLGLRDIDKKEQQRIEEGDIYATTDIQTKHLVNILLHKGITHLYLHFDFDCLNPSEFNKTYYQVPAGLTIAQSVKCIKGLKDNFSIVGSSVLESTAATQKDLLPILPIIDALMK
ncbi:MAG: arginase family protein [Croceivirga sp.]